MTKKQTKCTSFLVVLCLLFSLFAPFSVFAEENVNNDAVNMEETAVSGDTWNPEAESYKISTLADFISFRQAVNGGNDFAEKTVTLESKIEIPEGTDIGTIDADKSFDGTFNGNGYTIDGFNDGNAGLVTKLGPDGLITDVRMTVNLNILRAGLYGVFASSEGGSGRISKCSAEGDVTIRVDAPEKLVSFYGIGPVYMSGRAKDDANVSDCYTNLNVDVEITNKIVNTSGINVYGVTSCWSYNRTTGPAHLQGEKLFGTVANCYATGTVRTKMTDSEGEEVKGTGVYGIGNIMSADYVSNLYVDATEGRLDKDLNSGTAIKTTNVKPITDKSALTKAETYVGFDFDSVWTTNGDTTMPVLKSQQKVENSWNPAEESYVISTVADLKAFRESLNTGETYYRETEVNGQKSGKQTVVLLNNDIEIPAGADIGTIQKYGEGNQPATNFEGYFNGQGHTISGFSDTKVGLVDKLGTNGIITNLRMKVDLNFTNDSFDSYYYNHNNWESISYGVFSSYASGRVAYCSAEGDVSFDVDLSAPTAYNGQRSVGFFGILNNVTGGDRVYGWETVANCQTDFNYSVKAINGGEYTGVVLTGIANNSSNRSSMQGSMTNCFATATFGDCSVTKPDGSAGVFSIYGIGSVKSKDFVTGCYFDKTDGHYTKTNDLGSVINPVTSTDDLTKAKTYEGYDFENIWTTNGDTTTPQLKKDIPEEKLPAVIDDPEVVAVDVICKVPSKTVPDKKTATKGPVALFKELDITDPITNDDISVVGANGEDLSQYIKDYQLKGTITSTAVGSLKSRIYYTDYTDGEYAGVKYENYRFDLEYDVDNSDYRFVVNEVKFVDASNPSQAAILKSNGKDGKITEAEVKENIGKAKDATEILLDKFVASNPASSFAEKPQTLINNAWYIMTMARTGYNVPEGYYESFYNALSDRMASLETNHWGDLVAPEVTGGIMSIGDYFKVAGTVTAIGYDPRNVGGVDCIAPMYDYEKIKNDASSNNFTAKFYALIGLDLFGTNYDFSADKAATTDMRNKLLTELAENANKNWSGNNPTTGPDMACMLFTAIAPYYGDNATVKEAGDNLFKSCQAGQDCFGGYYALDVFNPASLAQVMISASAAGKDIFRDKDFINNGYSLIDAANIFIDFENRTNFNVQGEAYGGSLGVAGYQLPQAYESALRVIGESNYEGANERFYDMSDVKNSTIKVNDLINALPDEASITEENVDAVQLKSDAITVQYNALTEAQKKTVDTSKWDAVKAKLYEINGLPGDVDGNGKVEVFDASMILESLTDDTVILDDRAKKAADMDGSGVIEVLDASLILESLSE